MAAAAVLLPFDYRWGAPLSTPQPPPLRKTPFSSNISSSHAWLMFYFTLISSCLLLAAHTHKHTYMYHHHRNHRQQHPICAPIWVFSREYDASAFSQPPPRILRPHHVNVWLYVCVWECICANRGGFCGSISFYREILGWYRFEMEFAKWCQSIVWHLNIFMGMGFANSMNCKSHQTFDYYG